MATEQIPTSCAKLNCLCGAISLPGTYLKDTHFPIESEICHCNPCRYTSGNLLPTFFNLRQRPPADLFAELVAYQFTPYCIRYFCKTCGTHCFIDHPHMENDWFCHSAIVDIIEPPQAPRNLLKIEGQVFLADTVDGGLGPFFLSGSQSAQETVEGHQPSRSSQPPLFAEGGEKPESRISSQDVLNLAKDALAISQATSKPHKLSAKCLCGGIDLSIERADFINNPYGVAWYMQPPDTNHSDKYVAWFCACRSCRVASGSSLAAHMYIPPAAVTDAITGEQVVFGLEVVNNPSVNNSAGLRTLKHYRSSRHAVRSFCGRCGAYVFFCYTGEVPKGQESGIIDIAAGLLRADSGAMAREWAYWVDGKVSHADEAVDKDVLDAIKPGWKSLGLGQ